MLVTPHSDVHSGENAPSFYRDSNYFRARPLRRPGGFHSRSKETTEKWRPSSAPSSPHLKVEQLHWQYAPSTLGKTSSPIMKRAAHAQRTSADRRVVKESVRCLGHTHIPKETYSEELLELRSLHKRVERRLEFESVHTATASPQAHVADKDQQPAYGSLHKVITEARADDSGDAHETDSSASSQHGDVGATVAALRCARKLQRRLSDSLVFVDRSALSSFKSNGTGQFTEHWSTSFSNGVHRSRYPDQVCGCVFGLSQVLTEVKERTGRRILEAVFVPENQSFSISKSDASDVVTVHMDGDFARMRKGSQARKNSVSNAMVFYLEPVSSDLTTQQMPLTSPEATSDDSI